jgi:tetratricopeptide (TPR) repeat protein
MKLPKSGAPAGLFASPQRRNTIICLLLIVATLALYNPLTHHPFVNYDDDVYVTANQHVRAGLTWSGIRWAFTSTDQANWHPLTWISHELDWSLFRSNPAGHHFTSVLLHTLNAVLLFIVLVRASGRPGASLFVAALFAVHPLNVESVAWVAERKNVLCTTFFLLTLWAYAWYAQKPQWQRYLAVAALFAAGLASKPMVVTMPFVLLLWDYWPLQRSPQSWRSSSLGESGPMAKSLTWLLIEKIPLLVLSAASAVITLYAQQASGAMRSIAQFSFRVRVENAVWAYAMYLWKTIWPARLACLYPHPGNSLTVWQIAVSGAVLLAITLAVFRFRSFGYLVVGWLWFLGTLVPVIGLVQVGDAAMADRYAYIPLIGVFIMVAFGAADLAAARKLSLKWQAAAAAVVLLALALVTHGQIGYWQSSYDLWAHALAVTKNNFVAEDNLGGALLLQGKADEAFQHFESASRINPRDAMSHSNLGAYLESHGQVRAAIEQDQTAIALTSDAGLRAQAYSNLGAAQRALGQDESARRNFQEALRLNPGQSTAWLGFGLLEQNQGNFEEAIRDLSHAAGLHPAATTFLQLGRAQEQAHHRDQALAAYQAALKLQPDMTQAQEALDRLQRAP